jgi:hypothetical protein
VTLVAKV